MPRTSSSGSPGYICRSPIISAERKESDYVSQELAARLPRGWNTSYRSAMTRASRVESRQHKCSSTTCGAPPHEIFDALAFLSQTQWRSPTQDVRQLLDRL